MAEPLTSGPARRPTSSDSAPQSRVVRDLEEIGVLVGAEMGSFIDSQIGNRLDRAVDGSVTEVLVSYRDRALSGGKRLRPAFAFWAFEGAGGERGDPTILNVAVAVELLHTFALIHDDVMDQATTRRGTDTVHVQYRERHKRLGLRGDAAHYGESVAVLVGDLAFAHASLLMSTAPPDCATVFFEFCAELMVGQFLDIEAAARGPRLEQELASEIAEMKTARYTVEGPLAMGAAVVGRLAELGPYLRAYGNPVGHAFQLRDDLLGAFGDQSVTGKGVGNDLAQGKVTRLLEIGLQLSTGSDRDLLLRLGSDQMEYDDVIRAGEVLENCGARAEVETTITRLVGQATDEIRDSPVAGEIKEVLVDAARLVAYRDR